MQDFFNNEKLVTGWLESLVAGMADHRCQRVHLMNIIGKLHVYFALSTVYVHRKVCSVLVLV